MRVARRAAPAEREARSHCVTIARRMTTYPAMLTRKSACSNIGWMPAARMSTPPICRMVSTR